MACSRKKLFPVFLVALLIVIGLTVWLGIWSAAKEQDLKSKNDDKGSKNGTHTNGGGKRPDGGKKPAGEADFDMGIYRFASVAADDARCSQVGTRILAKKSGSAVDAAIASMLCIGVVNSQSTGIGGGSFMTIYDREKKKVVTYDFREEAPGGATALMYKGNPSLSQIGGLAIGVPGEIMGYWTIHQKYGKVKWGELFEPAIKMCEEGFKVGPALATGIKKMEDTIKGDEELRKVLMNNETGELLREGDTMHRPKLAKTLRAIAKDGAKAFYNGSLSQDIVDDIKDRGGIITLKDLTNYQVNEKPPIEIDLKGYKFYSVRPPSSGVITGLILNILDAYNFDSELLEKDPTLVYHRVTEAFKFAFAKRTELGDEDFLNINDIVANLTKEELAESIRQKVTDDQTQKLEYYEPTFLDRMDSGTSHLSVLAANGDAVSTTSTINFYFGSTVLGSRTGIIFNNEMDDFSSPNITNIWGIKPSPANFIVPGKRPLSSMSPSIFVDDDGDVKLIIGAAGGTKIITSTVLTALRTLWFDQNIKKAMDGRRIHHQLLPAYVQYEKGFDEYVLKGLKAKQHDTKALTSVSVVQAIYVDDDKVYAYCDSRKGGQPDGF